VSQQSFADEFTQDSPMRSVLRRVVLIVTGAGVIVALSRRHRPGQPTSEPGWHELSGPGLL
jgi:hypothetical protein